MTKKNLIIILILILILIPLGLISFFLVQFPTCTPEVYVDSDGNEYARECFCKGIKKPSINSTECIGKREFACYLYNKDFSEKDKIRCDSIEDLIN